MKNLKIISIVSLAIFVVFSTASAQITTKPIMVQKQIKLPTAQEMAKILRRERMQSKPINQADKLKAVNDLLKGKGVKTIANSLSLPVKMTVSSPKASAENYLMYFKPWNVMVTGETVQFVGASDWQEGSLAVIYTPPAPGFYLLDFSVRKSGDSSFGLFTLDGGNSQTQKYPPGAFNNDHVTFVVNLAKTERQMIFLFADKDWTFYECEISQVK